MQADSDPINTGRRWLHIGVGLAGLAVIAWLTWTFVELVETHTQRAQTVSHAASWAGQPVGAMPQANREAHKVQYDSTSLQNSAWPRP